LAFFIVYILSGVIHKLFFLLGILAVNEHPDPAFFCSDHHRLLPHAPDHVKRIAWTTAQGQLQGVFLNTLFQRLLQRMGDLEEPIGRAQPPDALMRTLVVVVLDPEGAPLHGLIEAVELGALEELVQDGFPEPFDLAQGHRVMGTRTDVMDPILFHFLFKPGFTPPVGVLPAVVGEHLLRHAVFGNRPTVGLQHMGCGLAAV
jgi:hypothetical protein